jgi:hypothetical protein
MGGDDFEKRLQRQPLRQVPAAWRAEILSAATQAARPHAASVSLFSTLSSQLSTLLWPRPLAWAGLAAVWLIILGLNLASRQTAPRLAKQNLPLPPQVFMAFQEQERVLAEIVGPGAMPTAQPRKPALPRPRSEGPKQMLLAQDGNPAAETHPASGDYYGGEPDSAGEVARSRCV